MSPSGKRCGRCKGRGQVRPLGLGPDVPCEDCGGTGEKQAPKPKQHYSVEYEKPAQLCRFEGRIPGRECYGRKTFHHNIGRQRIVKRLTSGRWVDKALAQKVTQALDDSRNHIEACHGCHLGLIETGNPDAQVTAADLPKGFLDFVREYGLEGDLPRHLQEVLA